MTTGLEIDEATSVALPWREWGAADAPRTALLLHGLSSAGAVWWRVADLLAARGFRVVSPDLRGHGDAPRTLRYPLGALAADVLRLRPGAAADGTPWNVVVAHSLGGAIAVLALAHYPSWARTAVLVDPALRNLRADNPVAFDAFVTAAIAEVEQPDAAEIGAAHPDWHAEDVQLKVRAAQQTSRHTVEGVLGDTARWDVESQFERIAVPVTVLGADPAFPDAAVSAALGERLAVHPNVGYAVATGSGHSIHRSDPERVVAEVLEITASDDLERAS
ncbi:alpha/beta fold hydrolase [Gryllotalpicola protaetiae]|uniref:Alpha/beta fold hydrolase n=1 Tax=Gryllotalpicola protaetiae TaxID=2419771 RepID=A0A387BZN0_9MICO|nr:alpha/beta fold hydrolase [Gryllotalpicola protaetiae]AYG03801.1 alpha/beta fold hydrolase [Gryllotalpicola protaetiae]